MVSQNVWEKRSSYGSYASNEPIFFGEGLLVTVVTQVTDQFFFGKGLVVTVVTLVTLVTDGVTECLGEKVKLRKLRKLRANFFLEKVC